MLRRLLDPETSTRRSPQARQRLREHPMTAALLDAGVRLMLAELGPGGDAATPVRFFDCLSAARVCAAASRLGPLRTTPAHLRDRWPRHADHVADLLSYALWFEQHFAGPIEKVLAVPGQLPEGTTVEEAAAALARVSLYTLDAPVTSRVEVLACALAASVPAMRATQRRNYADTDAVWGAVASGVLGAVGLRLRDGVAVADLARAVASLTEGANLRLMAHGSSSAARSAAEDDVALGLVGLLRAWALPAEDAEDTEDGAVEVPQPPQPRTELADVLPRLGGAATGTRATAAARRRLAQDGITQQLLHGGLAVLAEEFGVAESSDEPRFFASLSASRVVAEARSAGHSATAAQLRDRWARQEHYVDDLVGWALSRAGLLTSGTRGPSPETASALVERQTAEVHDRLRRSDGSPDFRLRLLLSTMAARASIVDDFAQQHAAADAALLEHTDALLASAGRRLADGVAPERFARTALAIAHGEVTRTLATGDDGQRGDLPALARATQAVLAALSTPV